LATAVALWIQSLDTEALDLFKRLSISICFAATRSNQIRAAQLLGVNRNTLRKKIRDLGLEVIKGLKVD
jgi:two-component system nitrogen regulation response regulator GlnG